MIDVSIIIVNYNTAGMLRDCLESIKQQTSDVDYEVIVVDNDSSDDSVKMLRKDFPEVILIESGANIGFGRANNLGMAHAKGEYLFLLNSDTILTNNAVREFFLKAEFLRENGRKIGVLGCILRNRDMSTCHSYGRFITPRSELQEVTAKYLRFLKDQTNLRPEPVKGEKNVDYVTGADMFLPRQVFESTGGFDPDFFMYCEEVDWQKRMEEAGLERLVVEGPEIIHLEGGSDSSKGSIWSPSRLRHLYESRRLYRRKHFSPGTLTAFRMLHTLLDAPSIILTAIMLKRKEYLHLINLK
ncbi:MAG: glycosyltransferase family 2 protein [Muribaculaceae bacterium]|nr:glycosyltransferase family 2 protein [Muribaculaceae bacterium]